MAYYRPVIQLRRFSWVLRLAGVYTFLTDPSHLHVRKKKRNVNNKQGRIRDATAATLVVVNSVPAAIQEVNSPPSAVNSPPSALNSLPSAANYLPSAVNLPPSVVNSLPSAVGACVR
eukprot:3659420-Pyramimonas_sp.AAC.1